VKYQECKLITITCDDGDKVGQLRNLLLDYDQDAEIEGQVLIRRVCPERDAR